MMINLDTSIDGSKKEQAIDLINIKPMSNVIRLERI